MDLCSAGAVRLEYAPIDPDNCSPPRLSSSSLRPFTSPPSQRYEKPTGTTHIVRAHSPAAAPSGSAASKLVLPAAAAAAAATAAGATMSTTSSASSSTPSSSGGMFGAEYFAVKATGISPFQTMVAYLGGSAFQTVCDNPVTAYRQLVQQFAKDSNGKAVEPKIASQQAKAVFKANPVGASMSGLAPRIVGVGFKRIPKFGFLLGISFITSSDGSVGMVAATGASIASAPFINPIRVIEKQQRAYMKTTGVEKPILDILKEAAAKNYKPLFRGTVPLMGHSLASATLGLVGQPKLQKEIKAQLGTKTALGSTAAGLISSAVVSPIYVAVTNPLSRLEVIMQTSSITGKRIGLTDALKEMANDSKEFGMRGIFRGQGIGIFKAVISLTLFHEGRIFLMDSFKDRNHANGWVPSA